MMTNDYRNTKYCPVLENVKIKKQELEMSIKTQHPRQKNMYNKVHDRNNLFNKKFIEIYNSKCAYCGVSIEIISKKLFEVDHFVAESLYSDKIEAGKLKNLILACYQCNRNKQDFVIENKYIAQLCPDNGAIANIFYRNEKYYICIKNEFKKDDVINEFYEKLQLDHQSRRLDYLLMNMIGLHKKIEGTTAGGKLAEAILLLYKKRNEM